MTSDCCSCLQKHGIGQRGKFHNRQEENAKPVTMLLKTGLNNILLIINMQYAWAAKYCSSLFSTTLLQARRFFPVYHGATLMVIG
jgi:hypothetical protein